MFCRQFRRNSASFNIGPLEKTETEFYAENSSYGIIEIGLAHFSAFNHISKQFYISVRAKIHIATRLYRLLYSFSQILRSTVIYTFLYSMCITYHKAVESEFLPQQGFEQPPVSSAWHTI